MTAKMMINAGVQPQNKCSQCTLCTKQKRKSQDVHAHSAAAKQVLPGKHTLLAAGGTGANCSLLRDFPLIFQTFHHSAMLFSLEKYGLKKNLDYKN